MFKDWGKADNVAKRLGVLLRDTKNEVKLEPEEKVMLEQYNSTVEQAKANMQFKSMVTWTMDQAKQHLQVATDLSNKIIVWAKALEIVCSRVKANQQKLAKAKSSQRLLEHKAKAKLMKPFLKKRRACSGQSGQLPRRSQGLGGRGGPRQGQQEHPDHAYSGQR